MDSIASTSGVGARTGQAVFQVLEEPAMAPQSNRMKGSIGMSALKLIESVVASSPAPPHSDFDIRA